MIQNTISGNERRWVHADNGGNDVAKMHNDTRGCHREKLTKKSELIEGRGAGMDFLQLCHLSFVVGFAEGLAFVIGVLALAEGDLHLSQSFVIDEEFERDNSLACVLCSFGEFANLAFIEQQFAVTFGGMVGIGAESVLGYMHLLDEDLSVLHRTIGIHQRGFAFPDGFDFRAVENNACRIAVKNDILKLSLLVQDPYVAL